MLLDLLDVVLQLLQLAVADLSHFAVVALALGFVGLELQVLDLLLVLLDLVDEPFFGFPFSPELMLFLLQLGNLLVELLDLVGIVFAFDGLALNFELLQVAGDLVELLRHRVAFHTQFGGGLIHQVDGLVGEETVRDIALREFHGCDAGIVGDTNLVVVLIALLQSTQDRDGVDLVRLVDHDGLEAALQCLVLLEVLLILVKGGGTNGTQLTTGQCRLEDVGGIHGTLATAGTHQSVDLVDEENDVALSVGHLFDDALESFLKLTFVLGTGDEGTHVERVELFVLQILRYITTHDALGEALDDSRLTGTRFTDQNRIVLGAARKNLQHTANLLITSDDRVEFALSGSVDEVTGVFRESLIVLVTTGTLHFLTLAQFVDGLLHLLLCTARILENAAHCGVYLQ